MKTAHVSLHPPFSPNLLSRRNPSLPFSSIYAISSSTGRKSSIQSNSPIIPLSKCISTLAGSTTSDLADVDWEKLGFSYHPTDFMYLSKCARGGIFSSGDIQPFQNLQLDPAAGVLNYGQGLFEGLKAFRKHDNSIILFRPEENAKRMITGADRLCMPSPSVEYFINAVKATVIANKRWVPPCGKGSLYIRPLLIGSGAVLGVYPSTEYTFLVYVTPVGNYFKEGVSPIHLLLEHEFHRAAPGGTGGVKVIGNYAAVLKAQIDAKSKGYTDVLYVDCVEKKYLEEVSSCNVFIVKNGVVATPSTRGTILPGITRKSVIDVARMKGYKVEERLVSVEELLDADEVFCTGTAVAVSPVGSVTYKGERVQYVDGGVGAVSQQIYSSLTKLQMGLCKDSMNWTMRVC